LHDMELSKIKKIVVIGAGVMGRGIAMVCARAGFDTLLFDIKQEMLDTSRDHAAAFFQKSVEKGKMTESERKASLDRLSYSTRPEDRVGQFVVEAVLENVGLKQKVFNELAELNGEQAIFASNTSTLPITRIAAGVQNPERVVGMHFFNPAPIMKLVEVISGQATAPQVSQLTYRLAEALGKKPVMARDEPGFIVNRVARHFYVESLHVMEEQVASFEVIDRLIRNYGFRMGPFELMDLIGIETNLAVTKSMYEAFFYDEKFRPSRIQQQKADAGHYGRKSGKGFYEY
jgi:3-hydroxybutyryl-CoA dehydrogenase